MQPFLEVFHFVKIQFLSKSLSSKPHGSFAFRYKGQTMLT